MPIHDPGNTQEIRELFVFMSIDEEGNHGIIASILPGLGSTPLVTGKERVAEMMKTMAQRVANETGKPVGLFRFHLTGQLWQSDPPPDWTQQDASAETVRAWMAERAVHDSDAETLARAAHEFFARPFHIDVMRRMATAVIAEAGR